MILYKTHTHTRTGEEVFDQISGGTHCCSLGLCVQDAPCSSRIMTSRTSRCTPLHLCWNAGGTPLGHALYPCTLSEVGSRAAYTQRTNEPSDTTEYHPHPHRYQAKNLQEPQRNPVSGGVSTCRLWSSALAQGRWGVGP